MPIKRQINIVSPTSISILIIKVPAIAPIKAATEPTERSILPPDNTKSHADS